MDKHSSYSILRPARLSRAFGSTDRPGGVFLTGEVKRDGENPAGLLIINADDWGLDCPTTDRTLECILRGTVTSVSAMLFMEDSERAAAMVRGSNLDVGLHLNFTSPFSAPGCPGGLRERQAQIASYLLRHRFAQAVFHPGLSSAFAYVVEAQLDEFRRLYGHSPEHLDGHHHAHLCSNVVLGGLMPRGTRVRRNFSFDASEKGLFNRLYRGLVDRILARRHHLSDYFFSLLPLDPRGRLQHIFSLARTHTVELETHPANPEEYDFLMGQEITELMANVPMSAAAQIDGRASSLSR
jgi:predicted glycoside hydrolase/deacetylase ChbG (UPF0249 family)